MNTSCYSCARKGLEHALLSVGLRATDRVCDDCQYQAEACSDCGDLYDADESGSTSTCAACISEAREADHQRRSWGASRS